MKFTRITLTPDTNTFWSVEAEISYGVNTKPATISVRCAVRVAENPTLKDIQDQILAAAAAVQSAAQ
jgi:uncharacterized protein with LGFP repeats